MVRLQEAVARFHKVLAAAGAGVPPPPRPINIRRAVHTHYAAELADDDRLEQPGRASEGDRFSEGFAASMRAATQRCLRRIAIGSVTEADWTDPDAAERDKLIKERLRCLRSPIAGSKPASAGVRP